MPAARLTFRDGKDHDAVPPKLAEGIAALEAELDVHDGFDDVVAAAEEAAADPRLPELDLTELEFVTIDPPDSLDLDQAVLIVRQGEGYTVNYAIADVAAFVTAGDPIDRECHRRGETLYAPNRRIGLHPPTLSEDAASLLADAVRPALVWRMFLDEAGVCHDFTVERALVKSRAKLSYGQVQAELDAGTATESLRLLREVGLLRQRIEIARGRVSLPLPDQEVTSDGKDWKLEFRTPLPVEGWNAQISLLTGMVAARLMVQGKVGILRTLPAADEHALQTLRRTARALKIEWPSEMGYPEFVRSLDPSEGRGAAMVNACARMFRGAGYVAFNGTVPDEPEHAALAMNYAHATAPLRRLVDRYVGEVCLALSANRAVPEWALAALDQLPEEMTRSNRRAGTFDRRIIGLTEALVLSTRVGQRFTGTLIGVDDDGERGRFVIDELAVEANVRGRDLPLGEDVTAELTGVDLVQGQVSFEQVRG